MLNDDDFFPDLFITKNAWRSLNRNKNGGEGMPLRFFQLFLII